MCVCYCVVTCVYVTITCVHVKLYTICIAVVGGLDGEESLSDVKNMIHKLYTSLNVDRHQVHTVLPALFSLQPLVLQSSWPYLTLPPSLPPSLPQLSKEKELRSQLDQLVSELSPLEQQRRQLAERSERRTNTGQQSYSQYNTRFNPIVRPRQSSVKALFPGLPRYAHILDMLRIYDM